MLAQKTADTGTADPLLYIGIGTFCIYQKLCVLQLINNSGCVQLHLGITTDCPVRIKFANCIIYLCMKVRICT